MKCYNAERNCDWVGTVDTLDAHVATCQFALVPCKYNELGCATELRRCDMTAHEEDDKLHLHMAIDTISELKKEKAKIVLKDGESMTFKVKIDETGVTETYQSPAFYTSCDGYCMGIEVLLNENDTISIYLRILKGDNDEILSWPFIGRVTMTLLNQLKNNTHHSFVMPITVEHDYACE